MFPQLPRAASVRGVGSRDPIEMEFKMKTIDAQQLESMMKADDDLVVINVLPRQTFENEHIPETINIPVAADDFVQQVEDAVESKNDDVVVYCADEACDASPKAAQKLEQAGFTSVYDFEGGMKEWSESGRRVAQKA